MRYAKRYSTVTQPPPASARRVIASKQSWRSTRGSVAWKRSMIASPAGNQRAIRRSWQPTLRPEANSKHREEHGYSRGCDNECDCQQLHPAKSHGLLWDEHLERPEVVERRAAG